VLARAVRIGAACLSVWLLAAPALAQFSAVETDEMRLVYVDPLENYLVRHVGRCFINSMNFEHELLGYTPSQKVAVILNDFSDSGNAAAASVPRNFLALETAPISTAFETVSPNERFNWLMNHELVHIATVDGSSTADRRARGFFGGKVAPNNDDPESIFYYTLTTPRAASPSWYMEGIAVFIETWMAGGQGRAQGPYDEMVFRSMVRDGSRFYDPLGLVSEGIKIDFQVTVNSYLYGARFMTYLAYRYSPEDVVRWVSRHDGSKAYYSRNFEAVFGKPLDQAWAEWIEFEKEFQQANLAAIRTYPTTPYRDVSKKGLGSVSRAFVDRDAGKIYVAFNYPGLVAHIGSISMADGSVHPIAEVKGPILYTVTSLAYDPTRHLLLYTTDNAEYRDVRSLDPATGETKTLLKDVRIGDLVYDQATRSLWGVRHFNGIASLVEIPYPYTEWKLARSWPYGEVPYDLDLSRDGTMLSASIGGIDGHHTVNIMKVEDLVAGKADPVATFDFGAFTPENFTFSDDGKSLYGSSYYTGVSNIFRYDLTTGKTEALSNAETGFFHPMPLADGSMLVFRYSGDGFIPATIDPRPLEDISPIKFLGAEVAETHPVVKSWKVGSPAAIPIDDLVTYRGPYHSFKWIDTESWYPIVEGYKDSAAVGVRWNLSDPMQFNHLTLDTSYSPDHALEPKERLHVNLKFRRYDWRVEAKWNGADFYDLFGPTKVSRKGYSLRTAWEKILYRDTPRKLTMTIDGAYYGGLDTLPYYQNIASPSDRLSTLFVKFDFENVRSSLGAVDAEKGQKAQLYLSETYTPGSKCNPALAPGGVCDVATAPPGGFYPQILATYDVGAQLPITHSSFWLRTAAGGGLGDPLNPFAQFYFGAFGNNWVDHGDIRRYRLFYAFPGLDINEVGGRTFAKAMLEWNLPPIRFRRFGTPGFFGTWARTSLFVGGLDTDFDHASTQRKIGDAGAQMDFRFTYLSRLDMTLSFGYAAAFESGFGPRHEAIVSLKVMQ
jgi:hypothetical protein